MRVPEGAPKRGVARGYSWSFSSPGRRAAGPACGRVPGGAGRSGVLAVVPDVLPAPARGRQQMARPARAGRVRPDGRERVRVPAGPAVAGTGTVPRHAGPRPAAVLPPR